MTAGLVACLVALAVATAVGLAWRANNGKMRAARARPAGGTTGTVPAGPRAAANVPRVRAADIGHPLGERATLLQFSSAFCAPCRATRRTLAEVAGMTDGVVHIEIDAESRLDLVRALGVLRTPTVLVLDAGGRIARRASGQPRRADVIGALGLAIDGASSGVAGAEAAAGEAGAGAGGSGAEDGRARHAGGGGAEGGGAPGAGGGGTAGKAERRRIPIHQVWKQDSDTGPGRA